MVIGALVNIVLDPIFIFTLDMGIQGAAIATAIAQFSSFLFTILVLSSKNVQVRIHFGDYKLKIIKRIMILVLSPFLIAATDSVVCIVLNAAIQNYGGLSGDTYITVATITN